MKILKKKPIYYNKKCPRCHAEPVTLFRLEDKFDDSKIKFVCHDCVKALDYYVRTCGGDLDNIIKQWRGGSTINCKQSTKNIRLSRRFEKSGANDINGKLHCASGSTWSQKADFSNDFFLVEDKFTHKEYYSISLSVLTKVEKQAKKLGKIPIMRFVFNSDGSAYSVLRKQDCLHLINNKESAIIITNNKSKKITKKELQDNYNKNEHVFLIELHLMEAHYIITRWDDFIFFRSKICE